MDAEGGNATPGGPGLSKMARHSRSHLIPWNRSSSRYSTHKKGVPKIRSPLLNCALIPPFSHDYGTALLIDP